MRLRTLLLGSYFFYKGLLLYNVRSTASQSNQKIR